MASKICEMLKNRILFYIFFIAITITGCAKRGTITGGLKDTIPPVIVRSNPANMSTNFAGNEIRIDFNEYVKIKDANKQLIISPPMETAPLLIPSGSASRYITIKIKDTLAPNTTYSFNFGQSITDNNEGNPYSQFRFVFSTGSYIDSLALNGRIKDSYTKTPDNFVTVMLYEANETFNDSTIFKERPRYVTNTLDSMVNFSLQNLKEGKYHLIALKDKNNNYKFDSKVDKIAFLTAPITIPTDTIYELELFGQVQPYKPVKPTQASSNRLIMGYEGDGRGMKVAVKNGTETLRTITTRFPEKDSVQVWLPRKIVADSLMVTVSNKDSIKDFNVRIKEMKAADSLAVTAKPAGGINFREKFTIIPSTPLTAFDESKISLVNKDSVAVPYTMAYNEYDQELVFDFVKDENQKYTFTLLPGALRDFYDKENDSLKYTLSTRSYADFGNLRLKLQNVNRFPLIVELTDKAGKVLATQYSEEATQIDFENVVPENYTIRVIYDDNKNKEWDSGNYLEKRQAEEVIYFPSDSDIRANWDKEEIFNLGG